MPIRGVVTTGHVLRNARLIVREFGPGAFLRCCLAIVSRRRKTLLACVTPPCRGRLLPDCGSRPGISAGPLVGLLRQPAAEAGNTDPPATEGGARVASCSL